MGMNPTKLASQERMLDALQTTGDLREALERADIGLAYHQKWLQEDETYAECVEATGVEAGVDAAKELRLTISREHRSLQESDDTEKLSLFDVIMAKEAMVDGIAKYGTPMRAAAESGVSYRSHRDWLKSDKVYAQAVADAMEKHTQVLEDAAVKRAAEGTLRPKFHQGKIVGHERVHHDQLLMFLLKGRRPEVYRDGDKAAVQVIAPNAFMFPERSQEEKLERMRDAMVKFGYSPEMISETLDRARQLASDAAGSST